MQLTGENTSVVLLESALTHDAVHVLGDTLDRRNTVQKVAAFRSHDGAHTARYRLCHHRSRRGTDDGDLESRAVS